MENSTPFILFESSLGQIVRTMQPEGLDPDLDRIPIVFQARMPDALRQRFRQSPVLNNDVQLKLAAEIRRIVQVQLFPSINDNTRFDNALRDRVVSVFQRATPGLEKVVNDAIAASVKSTAMWNDYRTDSGKEVARIGATLAFVAVAAGLSPPTSGVALGFMIVSLVRGLTDATKKFSEAYRTAEESRARILAEIARLKAAYGKSSTLGRASQLGGAVAHALTIGKLGATFNSDPLPGFTRIKTELNAYKGKLGHLGIRAEQLGRRLYELLDLIDQYQRARAIDSTRSGNLPPKLGQLRDEVTALLEDGVKSRWFRGKATISGAWQRSQSGLEDLARVERDFKELKALEGREKSVLIADRALTLLTNLGVTLAGYNGPLGLHGHSADAIQEALHVSHDGHASIRGGVALSLGFMRQFMSLFKDTHALAKELGLVTKKPDEAEALLKEMQSEFHSLPVPDQAPRLPGISLDTALHMNWTDGTPLVPPRPPVPTRRLPPTPAPTRALPQIPIG